MGDLCISIETLSAIRDPTERAMSRAMKMEQTGSAIIQPNICIRMADTITPTEPRVSARMWRNTPCMIWDLPPR